MAVTPAKSRLSGTETNFRFSTEILVRLGEELNPNADQGILELVKNAYDADARRCTVALKDTEAIGGTITVEDDGVGMDATAIREAWLVLGRSGKSTSQPTPKGRRPAGSKGLGRLAALRLGETAELLTWRREEPEIAYSLSIDWGQFDRAKVVEDVQLRILRVPRPTSIKTKSGTRIVLSKLRHKLGRVEAKRLARALILLADPFGEDTQGFRPSLITADKELKDLAALVTQKYFDAADFHLHAILDAEGHIEAEFSSKGVRGRITGTHAELSPRKARYLCPPATVDLWTFLKGPGLGDGKLGLRKGIESWLTEFGGIHIYENALRVTPYGDPGSDWLDINKKRVASPEHRPSTNNSIGRILIDHGGGKLVQKTDRSGYIENEAFFELKEFALVALEWMFKRRVELADKSRVSEKKAAARGVTRARKQLDAALENVPQRQRVVAEQAVGEYERQREREMDALRKDLQLYRTLATAGIMSAVFYHEARAGSHKIIDMSIATIERRTRKALGETFEKLIGRDVENIKNASSSLSAVGDVTLGLLAHEKRVRARSRVHAVIDGMIERFKPYLTNKSIVIEHSRAPGSPQVRTTEAALESIIANLLSNAVTAFEASKISNRRISISTTTNDGSLVLRVADNGPGVSGISLKDIWLPGQTTKQGGTGLGLTIIRDITNDMGGRVTARSPGTLGGAEFIIELPLYGETEDT